jgi:integrase
MRLPGPSVASEDHGFRHRPTITMLKESRPRQGFFTREEIATVCTHLPPELAAVVRFGYITAWRASEVLGLEWSRVDLSGRGRVWLDRGMTKNGEPRTFKLTAELRDLLEARLAETEKLKAQGRIVPHVFHRTRLVRQPDGTWKAEPGQAIKSFTKAWRAACATAGYPGRIFHDLRRSAIRNFVRAGVSETVAMKLSGHVTNSTFKRYNITDESDHDDAADKLDAAADLLDSAQSKPEKQFARVRQFSTAARSFLHTPHSHGRDTFRPWSRS